MEITVNLGRNSCVLEDDGYGITPGDMLLVGREYGNYLDFFSHTNSIPLRSLTFPPPSSPNSYLQVPTHWRLWLPRTSFIGDL